MAGINIDKFPYPNKPETFENRFTFPEDVTVLDTTTLGALRSKIGAYRGYISSLLARELYNYKILEWRYELRLAEESSRLLPSCGTQKAAEKAAMSVNGLRELSEDLANRDANKEFYEKLSWTYDTYLDIISREFSRRAALREGE